MIAVVDRIEDYYAVLLVGPEETLVDFPLSLLPPVKEGTVLRLAIEVDQTEEDSRREQAQSLLDKLLSKKKQE